MTFEQIIFIFPAIFNFSFALFIYLKNRKSIINIAYFISLSSVGLWALVHYAFYTNIITSLDPFLLKGAYFTASFIPPSFYCFTIMFTSNKILSFKKKLLFFLPNLIFVFLYFFGNLMIVGTSYLNGLKIFLYGPLYLLFDIQFSFFFILSFFSLFKAYKNASGKFKLQLKYVAVGTIISVILAGTANIIMTDIFHNFSLAKFAPFLSLPMFIFIGYTILVHHLMDINIVIRKTTVYSILATIITIAYFLLIYTMETLFRGFIGYKSIPWTLSVIVIFTLIFQPLKNLIQSILDKYFFKQSRSAIAEELKKAQEELKRTERLKAVGTLAAGMAHEIKNPLTAIKTFTEYLPSKYTETDFIEKFHKIVSPEVNRIDEIVQQLLDFSKPRPLKLQECDIHKVIEQTLSFLSNDFVKFRIEVIKNYTLSPSILSIDPHQMQQVFLNLFLNAIDAMKEGGKLTVITKPEPNIFIVYITDTGIGMSKKDVEHIFDPFYSTKETGTGLGMSIVYGIIKEHGGEINVESKLGRGTTFTIRLPLQPAT